VRISAWVWCGVLACAPLFAGGSVGDDLVISERGAAPCHKAAGTNDDGELDASDAVANAMFLFLEASRFLPAPFAACAYDQFPDALSCARSEFCDPTEF
jgi:hypothetical protein